MARGCWIRGSWRSWRNEPQTCSIRFRQMDGASSRGVERGQITSPPNSRLPAQSLASSCWTTSSSTGPDTSVFWKMEGCREGFGACVAAAEIGNAGSETIFSVRVADETQPGRANYPGKSIRNQIPFVSITAGITQIEQARGFLGAATLSESWVREMGHRAPIDQRLAVEEVFPFHRKGGSR